MTLRIGVNGLGRIGRCLLRKVRGRDDLQVVAVNDLAPAGTLAHLLRHDSIHGPFPGTVEARGDDSLWLDGRPLPYTRVRAPAEIPWSAGDVDVVVEATGQFSGTDLARAHLGGSVQRVLVSAVCAAADRQIVLGIDAPDPQPGETLIAMGSCTTHAAALPLACLEKWYGIEAAEMTTLHCTTGSQMTIDGPHDDLRRSRSALVSMIPTTTSASRGLVRALPFLEGRLSCLAVRVPTASVSLVEIVAHTRRRADPPEDLAARFVAAAAGPLEGLLGVSREPLVSVDFRDDPRSSIIDLPLIERPGTHLLRIIAWYDNEWGYTSRLVDLLGHWSARTEPHPSR